MPNFLVQGHLQHLISIQLFRSHFDRILVVHYDCEKPLDHALRHFSSFYIRALIFPTSCNFVRITDLELCKEET
jgi:hypothetical protein